MVSMNAEAVFMQKRNIIEKNIIEVKFVAGSCDKVFGISIKARLSPVSIELSMLSPVNCICIPHIPNVKRLATIEMKK